MVKNISYKSSAILQHFINAGKACFTIKDVFKVFPDDKEGTLKELLSDMTRRGLIMRIKRGSYYIIPYENEPKDFLPDWHLLADCLTDGANHYIGYYSALQVHNLITQPSLHEIIVVNHQVRPAVMKVKGISFQFVFHNNQHFFGKKKIWIDAFNKVWCSDLEKTFIDCLYEPAYAGGITEIAKALYASKTNIDFDKLLDYCLQFNAGSVAKRLGFLLDLLEIPNTITGKLQDLKTGRYILLDNEMGTKGERNQQWNIQQNIDTGTIKSSILT